MEGWLDRVRAWYDRDPEAEWRRLESCVEFRPSNVALARRKIAEAGADVGARVEAVLEGSFTHLPMFADGAFDAVLCLLLIAGLNQIGLFRNTLQARESWETQFRRGLRARSDPDGEGWPAYAFMPEALVAALHDAGLRVVRLYGCQGIAANLPPEHLEALEHDPARWPIWKRVLLDTCDHPNVVGVSSLILAVAHNADGSAPGR
ncbi:MAG: class I SAM-dependent methyltransferase [Chloroflexi bacterium]|nr:class I SAM-dependent methyltransferase [Chloroflexota bacterium]